LNGESWTIQLLLQPPVSGIAISLLVSGLTVDISQWRCRLSTCVRAHGGHQSVALPSLYLCQGSRWTFCGSVC